MNRIFLLTALGIGLLAGTASAQTADVLAGQGPMAPPPMGMTAVPGSSAPTSGIVTGGCAGCGANAGYAQHSSRYGWNPIFRKLAFWKGNNTCGTCGGGLFSRLRSHLGLGGGSGAGGYGADPAFNPYPNGVPGTLVFPNHYYARSPRDFFMQDGR